MANFTTQQQQVRQAMQQTVGNLFPFDIEQMGRQNMAMIERAMSLFSPFYRRHRGAGRADGRFRRRHTARPRA